VRFVVVGAGAVGGVVGARLALAGADVHLVARGAHLDAIRSAGLRLRSPDGDEVVRVPASDLAGLRLTGGDVVLLVVKSQDSAAVLADLAAGAPAGVPIVCVQNGVANEREALRRFPRVSGVCVMCPTAHLEPGVVVAYSSPTPGLLDVGRYPDGVDAVDEAVAAAFRSAGFGSEAVPDVMRWKYGKLLLNLGNAVEAVCGPAARPGEVGRRATEEGVAVLTAAGIPFASREEDAARRGGSVGIGRVDGERRRGGSSWQSLERAVGSVETDHLNGEIVLLGRLHGVPTPVNEVLQRLAGRMAARRQPPGTVSEADVLAEAGRPGDDGP
jgi:2-dehydropantoate 2-reductase